MDPSYVDSEDEAEAMAKAMGFSSFGNQGPLKKRKFNPKTDAVVDGQGPAEAQEVFNNEQGSGGNRIPLGRSRVFPTEADDEVAQDKGVALQQHHPGTQHTPAADGINEVESSDGPAYLDTSLPAPSESAGLTQARIDAILAASAATASTPTNAGNEAVSGDPGGAQAGSPGTRPSSLPQRPGPRGQRNEQWYLGYYDPSFNENPWAQLEREKGLA
jgi:hypothetical protein